MSRVVSRCSTPRPARALARASAPLRWPATRRADRSFPLGSGASTWRIAPLAMGGIVALALGVGACGKSGDSSTAAGFAAPAAFTVTVSTNAPQPVKWAAADVAEYLRKMGRTVTGPVEAEPDGACTPGQGKVEFLNELPAERIVAPPVAIGGVVVEAPARSDQTFRYEETRCGKGTVVRLSGGGLLGRQYAAYEWLHSLGVRFFHPEQEYIPQAPGWPVEPVSREHTPAYPWRSVSLHLTHPLELGDVFQLGIAAYADEAKRYIDWQIKNLSSFGNAGVHVGELDVQRPELREYGNERGLIRSSGFALHNQQQGGTSVIDPDDPRSVEQQIKDAVDARMGTDPARRPRHFQFTFNPSEFTEIDDQQAVREMTILANYFREKYPEVMLYTINHGSHGEPTDHYGVRFYELPQFAPSNLGVSVHTLMFYDLTRPAPVYGNENFHFHYRFMEQEATKRPLWYFPEAAWWLTFDIALPLYLPISIEARGRDLETLAWMLPEAGRGGKLTGHRTFGTGHEWGYWQNEYCALRLPVDLAYTWQRCVADITSPMGQAGPEVAALIGRSIAWQERDMMDKEILRYLVGVDPETEAAFAVGVVFHPMPPSPLEIGAWDQTRIDTWKASIPAALERSAADYAGAVAELKALRPQVPADALPWFDEIADGYEINGLRARHAREAYGAMVTLREARLKDDAALLAEAQNWLSKARATTEEARTVIHRREAGYRYKPLSRSIGGGESGREDRNWTVYRFRYLNRTHNAYYWVRVNELAQKMFEGSDDGITVEDAILTPTQPLKVATTLQGLSEVKVEFGDGQLASQLPVEHNYAAPGIYKLKVTAKKGLDPVKFEADIAVVAEEWNFGFGGKVVDPPKARLLNPVLPAVVVGSTGAAGAVIGFAKNADGMVPPGRFAVMLEEAVGSILKTVPTDVPMPIVNRQTGAILVELTVFGAVLHRVGPNDPLTITGELETLAVADAVVDIGGFDQEGAIKLVASTLGFTPETLPAKARFVIEYTPENTPGR